MKREERIALKSMAIKARVYNQIRTDLFKKLQETEDSPSYKPWRDYKVRVEGFSILTNEEKITLFDKWFGLNKEAHEELNKYKKKRQYKAEIQRLRDIKDSVKSVGQVHTTPSQ